MWCSQRIISSGPRARRRAASARCHLLHVTQGVQGSTAAATSPQQGDRGTAGAQQRGASTDLQRGGLLTGRRGDSSAVTGRAEC